ncbi:polysaccharide biosynthesis protein [Patescibacteria group bacterium AH-259-L05]|nr:polysaccharide biosynthesis protein [Patescibacteria group bacterium AH-259-L05]
MKSAIKKLKQKILARTTTKRTIFFLLGDIVLITLSCWLGFFLRFDGSIPYEEYSTMIKGFILLAVPVTIFFFWLEKLYSISWSFISVNELLKLFRAVVVSFLVVGTELFIFREHPIFAGFPRSIIFISGFLTLLTTGGLRFSKRIYLHGLKRGISYNGKKRKGIPVVIIGAGDAGEQLSRHILSSKNSPYAPVGFIDDNPMKQGVLIHGVKVLGTRKNIPDIIKKHNVEELIIAMPSASQKAIRETVESTRKAGVEKIKILPGTKEILAEKVSLSHIREVSIEDLLGRDAVTIDTQSIKEFISRKTVLVTGAAGSIGSHLCEQILNFSPENLIALDQNETGIFHLERDLKKKYPNISKSFIVGDICDKDKIEWLFNTFKPDVVFHAAAYKHVPVMESHPDAAVKNNIFGTLIVGETALKYGTEKLVLISTDKAVNPSSVMGATKQVGEMICLWLNKQDKTKFCAVRFGNVLDSQGNVVGIFEQQIKKGGPVEVTGPDMKRYFMVTAEACLLVMQAGATSKGGEVFVLDMGKPMKVLDLAREMIKLAGYEPDVDIPIVFIKPRPGEKMFEELLTDSETPTKHEKIFIAKLSDFDEQKLINGLEKLKTALTDRNKDNIIKILKELIPTYK